MEAPGGSPTAASADLEILRSGTESSHLERTYDVLVAGAGPAGSVAAYWLARSGLDVLVLDRARFPRVKACAAGVTKKAARAVDFDLSPAFDGEVARFECLLAGKEPQPIDAGRKVVGMTHREVFDTHLMARAVEAGARFAQETRIEAIAEEGKTVRVFAGKRAFRGKYLVGADGASGITSRALGARHRNAPTAEVLLERETARDSTDWTIRFDFAALPKGYGWVFPKGRGASVGLGTLEPKFPALKSAVERYAKSSGEPGKVVRFLGATIPVGHSGPVRSARTLLAGDAAGLADPFTGEGIAQAMESGRAAAETIAASLTGRGDSRAYERQIFRLRREQRSARLAAFLFHSAPGLFYRRLLQRDDAVAAFLDTLDGRATNTRWLEYLAIRPWRLLPHLAGP